MEYQSTRDPALRASAAAAVLRGLAPDGGLYVTEDFGGFDWRAVLSLDVRTMAGRILSFLLPDLPRMDELVRRAYAGKFETDDLTPLVPVGGRYVLELFRGPTAAFKDVALSLLPQLIAAARRAEGERGKTLILTATSGDTGKAALAGFADVEGTEIIVFYPEGGVSPVQHAQMTTQTGGNVEVCAVRGNFDDAQAGVKRIFGLGPVCGTRLSSANSINIGRLAPQTVYYFKAYAELVRLGRIAVGERVDFAVPTGNFGNILAGYLAKRMGLPVGKLVCASNRNDVLTDFFRTGVYDSRRPFYRTTSPSMDILISSNLERLLWLLRERDDEVAGYMRALAERGFYRVPERMLGRLREEFACGSCDEKQTAETIGAVWRVHGYLLDPHTAVAWRAAEGAASGAPMVVLATASPFKFPATVLRAIGQEADADEFAAMERLGACTGLPVPPSLADLRGRPTLHRDVIDCGEMREYVWRRVRQWEA